jgi:hypothetical protein
MGIDERGLTRRVGLWQEGLIDPEEVAEIDGRSAICFIGGNGRSFSGGVAHLTCSVWE